MANYDARLDRLEQRFGVTPRSTRLLIVHRRDDGTAVVEAGGQDYRVVLARSISAFACMQRPQRTLHPRRLISNVRGPEPMRFF